MIKTLTIKQISPLQTKAEELSITDYTSLGTATQYLSEANQFLDSVIESKKKVTDPLNLALKNERARFKPLEEALEAAIGVIREKMSAYQTELVRKQREEEAKIAAKVESGYLKPETAVNKLENLPEVVNESAAESGSVQFVEVKKFEVTNMSILPLEYILSNDVAIRKAMLAGIDIPGVRYFTEMQPKNFR